jgi:hypothetical protein
VLFEKSAKQSLDWIKETDSFFTGKANNPPPPNDVHITARVSAFRSQVLVVNCRLFDAEIAQ